MYMDFFGLSETPFSNTPNPRFFFSTPEHEEALAYLIYAVRQAKGFVLLTGEAGTGKTLLSRMLLNHFSETVTDATINQRYADALEFMEAVCAEFDLPCRHGMSCAMMTRMLQDFLLSEFASNRQVVLVIDEAQSLPWDCLEQIRILGNLDVEDAKLLQIVLLGQPELGRILRLPPLKQLHQRIFREFHLSALTADQTKHYIRHRLQVAGADDLDLFSEEATRKVHGHCRGLPRAINNLCDNALLVAFSSDKKRIDAPFMQEMIQQLQEVDPGAAPPALMNGSGGRPQLPRRSSRPAHGAPFPSLEAAAHGSSLISTPHETLASMSDDQAVLERLRALEAQAGRLMNLENRLVRFLDLRSRVSDTPAREAAFTPPFNPSRQRMELSKMANVVKMLVGRLKTMSEQFQHSDDASLFDASSVYRSLDHDDVRASSAYYEVAHGAAPAEGFRPKLPSSVVRHF